MLYARRVFLLLKTHQLRSDKQKVEKFNKYEVEGHLGPNISKVVPNILR